MNKDILSFIQTTFIILCSLCILFISSTSHALVFSILPKTGTTLPTSVNQGGTVAAYYTVYNLTSSKRDDNFVKYLPPNVSQITTGGTYGDTCGLTFSLTPNGQAGYTCTLQLTIAGAVSSSDPSPSNHLFVCFPGGKTCAGTNYPLNVTQSSLTSIAISPISAAISVLGTKQYTATGTYSNNSTADITTSVTWNSSVPGYATISSTGLATGIALGTTDITASLDALTSNTATLTVETPVTVSLTTPTDAAANVSVKTPIVITFSGAVDAGTVTNSTFKVGTTAGGSDISGSIVMSAGNTVATFTPTAALNFNSTVYVTVTSGILDAGGDAIIANSFTFNTQIGYLIYILSSPVLSGGNLGGVTGADSICQNDSQCPVDATCQAMLVGTNGGYTREASPTLTNWVLQASTQYFNTNNDLIGTTTSDAIFTFPLSNTIQTSGAGGHPIWTGLKTDWTDNVNNCTNWTASTNLVTGTNGVGNQVDTNAIAAANFRCNFKTHYLYCVQQP